MGDEKKGFKTEDVKVFKDDDGYHVSVDGYSPVLPDGSLFKYKVTDIGGEQYVDGLFLVPDPNNPDGPNKPLEIVDPQTGKPMSIDDVVRQKIKDGKVTEAAKEVTSDVQPVVHAWQPKPRPEVVEVPAKPKEPDTDKAKDTHAWQPEPPARVEVVEVPAIVVEPDANKAKQKPPAGPDHGAEPEPMKTPSKPVSQKQDEPALAKDLDKKTVSHGKAQPVASSSELADRVAGLLETISKLLGSQATALAPPMLAVSNAAHDTVRAQSGGAAAKGPETHAR